MQLDWESASIALSSLVIFRSVAEDPALKKLQTFLKGADLKIEEKAEGYGAFVRALFEVSYDLTAYLEKRIIEDENDYVLKVAHRKEIPPILQACVMNELAVLSAISRLDPKDLAARVGYAGYLPLFENSGADFLKLYEERLQNVERYGYGIFAANRMFNITDGVITPVRSADPIEIHELIGYEAERQQVVDNTRALLAGKPAANILLCGDAGTGKSSTVKAVTNLLAGEGLRLIELRKEQILQLPSIMDQISRNPLKFIIFIDDLSFNKNDDCFGTLKAILEGSVSARNKNTVIYATSNRRHLIKENFSDRDGDDVHHNDTLQELLSLSERFGMTVLFQKPNKELYLKIVHQLAKLKNIDLDEKELDLRAEAFALKKGGRSARAAEQFTDHLLSEEC